MGPSDGLAADTLRDEHWRWLREQPLRVAPGVLAFHGGPEPHLIEAGSPHARFAVIDDASGAWEATFHAIEYPWEDAAAAARTNGRPDVEHALLTGRAG